MEKTDADVVVDVISYSAAFASDINFNVNFSKERGKTLYVCCLEQLGLLVEPILLLIYQ